MRAPNPCRRRRLVSLAFALPLFTAFTILALLIQDGGLRRTGSYQGEVMDAGSDVMVTLRSSLLQREYIDRRGVHVVIGYYQGNGIPWESTPNLTDGLINTNGYNPVPGLGEMGQPVYIKSDHALMKQLFHINSFNLMASDRIALNRSLPDVRKKECKPIDYNTASLPSTSVIIVFHNEAWSTLLRTVHSVINRSPQHLLQEIILVDDASERLFLKQPLEDYIKSLEVPVKIVRLATRSGLIRARIRGAKVATGQILTFLDAHCECTTGWLEPLLHSIKTKRTRVACPVIDIINDDTFAYVRSFDLHWGAFNWELHFRWYAVSDSVIRNNKGDVTLPFRTPVMAGGLFAIDRNYFYEIGTYDSQMDIWGGENIEMSFRVWQCGGSIEIVPCSHVGHVFRKSSPYTFPRAGGVGAVLYGNLVRVAAVWMDEWTNFYYLLNPETKHLRSSINVTERLELRERLQCKSFRWYLDNVWPEHFLPTKDRFFGKIQNQKNKECLQKPQGRGGTNQATGNALTYVCTNSGAPHQYFVVSPDGYVMTDESVCLDSPHVGAKEPAVVLLACNQLRRQRWSYQDGGALMHLESGLCLDLPNQVPALSLVLKKCTGSPSQTWSLEAVDWT